MSQNDIKKLAKELYNAGLCTQEDPEFKQLLYLYIFMKKEIEKVNFSYGFTPQNAETYAKHLHQEKQSKNISKHLRKKEKMPPKTILYAYDIVTKLVLKQHNLTQTR